jgi:hypothetical protein
MKDKCGVFGEKKGGFILVHSSGKISLAFKRRDLKKKNSIQRMFS